LNRRGVIVKAAAHGSLRVKQTRREGYADRQNNPSDCFHVFFPMQNFVLERKGAT
jgi:hypothetical protein